jgi:hypothetical protein
MSKKDDCDIFGSKPCDAVEGLQGVVSSLRKKVQNAKVCCDNEEYKEIHKYFKPGKSRNRDLLIALQQFYKTKKTEDINFTLSLDKFIHKFPRDTALKDNNFKRQHIFEQICRLLLFFNYDDGKYGNKKEFYPKLEDYNSGTKGLAKIDLMKERINEGSKAGSVDIFFKLLDNGKGPNVDDFYCNKKISKTDHNKKNTYILVQNKYYDNESTDIAKYDAPKIFSRASKILDKVDNFKVVLMVNSSKILNDKLKSFDKDGIEILGVKDIEPWFQKLLQDLSVNHISKFLTDETKSFKKLEPRFHQKLFIDSSLRHYQEQKRRKFIWGAVPRSGKSYIIGGMVSKRAEMGSNNNVVIIMGAKAETIGQFTELFEFKENSGFTDFKDFGFSTQDKINEKSGKNIYLMSQEFFKMNKLKLSKEESTRLNLLVKKKSKTNNEEKEMKKLQSKQKEFFNKPFEFKSEIKEKFPKLFRKGNKIDIYFDEIHKGGSTDKSMEILQAFVKEDMVELLFMVTATFAKPSIAYQDFIDDKPPVILQWGYEEQQLMKNINVNEVNLQIVKEQRNNDIDREVIDKILIECNEKYGIDYLRVLADEYKKHPELVLINPLTIGDYKKKIGNFFEERDITDTLFALDCKAVDYENKSNLKDYKKIFQKSSHVDQLLNFLTSNIGLYNYLEHKIESKMKIKVFDEKPTQLWFLPVTGLFKDSDCKPTGEYFKTKKGEEKKFKEDETGNIQPEEFEEEQKENLPHIEPVTRGLALAIMNNKKFKENYNVLIVHNNGPLFDISNIKSESSNSINCVSQKEESKKTSLVDKIKFYESKAKKNNKGLIILTGTKLRLGVSLPCADIALNFDNVQSIDSNYQTMFRVLTERNDNSKKYGYYVDFNLDRTKSFIYDFALIYSNKMKQNNSFNEIKESLSNIYELFNFNGISFGKSQDFKQVLNMYKNLNDRLGINDENLKNMYIKNYERTIGKIMLKYDISKLKEINNLVKGLFKDSDKITDIQKGSKKDGGKKTNTGDKRGNNDTSNDEEEKEEEEKDIDIVKNLRIFLPSIVALLSLFSSKPRTGESDFDCNNLEDCLDKAIESVETLPSICDCKSEPVLLHPIGCYIQKFKDIDPKDLRKLLQKIKEVIFTDEFNEVRQHLNLLYNNIRMDFKLTGGGKKIRTKKLLKGGRIMRGGTRKLIDDMNNQEIMAKIQQYLPIRKEMKDKHGEVFTPYELIKEMMDKLNEIDPSFFKNPHLKWLDPANGIGNFPMVVFKMLNEGLKKSSKKDKTEIKKKYDYDLDNDVDRKNHIIKNMLYMVELQADNVMVSRKIFGKYANIFCGSFLTEDNKSINPDITKKFGVEKFDVIMGNPPFQKAVDGKRKGGYGGRTLWDKFIELSFEIMNKNGYLGFINPSNWRGTGGNSKSSRELIFSKQLEFLHIYNKSDGIKYFNAGTRFDLYIVKNTEYKKNVKIIDELGESYSIDLKEFPFIPNYKFKSIKKILTTQKNGINVIYSSSIYDTRKLKDKKKSPHLHPVVHTITQDKITYWYTNDTLKGHFGVPKILLNFNEKQYSHQEQNDYRGKYGMSQITFGIPISSKKEGELILKAINTSEFKEIIKATKWGAFVTEWRMFTYFKKDFWKEFVDSPKSLSLPKKTQKKRKIKSV